MKKEVIEQLFDVKNYDAITESISQKYSFKKALKILSLTMDCEIDTGF